MSGMVPAGKTSYRMVRSDLQEAGKLRCPGREYRLRKNMLESLHIKNFRSCEDVRIQMGEPVVALVGKNGVGKTNLLHALQLVADLCAGDPESMFGLAPRDRSSATEFNLTFSLDGLKYEYTVRRTSPPVTKDLFEEVLTRDGQLLFERNGESLVFQRNGGSLEAPGAHLPPIGLQIGLRAASLPSLLQIFPQIWCATVALQLVWEYLRAIRYYPLLQGFQEHMSDRSPVIEALWYETWKAQLAQGIPPRSVQLRLLHLWLEDRPRFEELTALLGENGLGLIAEMRIEEITLRRSDKTEDAPGQAYSISFMPGTGLAGAGRWFQFSGLSAGTLRILQLLTYLVFDRTSCMLLEQPEDCIHPGLLAKVIDILRTYAGRTQLICTTHSPRVMNLVGGKGIRFVTANAGRTQVKSLTPDQLAAAATYLADEGTLSEFLDTL